MSQRHELDLLGNAFDSLNESIRRFDDGTNGESRAYKFAILHFSHFIELLFKYYVTESHHLLIYKNPFSKKIEKEQTIGLWDALQFLKNDGHEFDPQMIRDLEWIKELRNRIEHHKFDMEVREVRQTLGRLFKATVELNEQFQFFELDGMVDPECMETFTTLSNEYSAKLAEARHDALEESPNGKVVACPECGETSTAYIDGDKLVCKFCSHEDSLGACCQCGDSFPMSELSVWNDDDAPLVDYICEGCEGYIRSKD